jgi:hypothetical protein
MGNYKRSQGPISPLSQPVVTYETVVPNPKLKLLDQMREVMRLKHYSIRTERTYCDWVRRYVQFHHLKSREAMLPAEPKMEAFLSDLAAKGNVAVSTQNQAFNALLFVYREVLHVPVGNIESVRATRPARVPTVLTPEEARRVIQATSGTPQLVVKLISRSARSPKRGAHPRPANSHPPCPISRQNAGAPGGGQERSQFNVRSSRFRVRCSFGAHPQPDQRQQPPYGRAAHPPLLGRASVLASPDQSGFLGKPGLARTLALPRRSERPWATRLYGLLNAV